VAEARVLLDQWQLGMGLKRPENWHLSSYYTKRVKLGASFASITAKKNIKMSLCLFCNINGATIAVKLGLLSTLFNELWFCITYF